MPSVFISYCWDSAFELNGAWVEKLARKLSADGIAVRLDKWMVKPGDIITSFMHKGIVECDKVLMICTPKYKESVDTEKGAAGYEGIIITSQIWLTADHRKYIPVLKQGDFSCSIPEALRGKHCIDMRTEHLFELGYAELIDFLKSEPGIYNYTHITAPERGRDSSYNYNNLSFAVLEKLGRSEISSYIKYYRKLILKNPHNDKAYFGLGLCALHYGMVGLAAEKLRKARDINPALAEYHYYYALSLCSNKGLQKPGFAEITEAAESAEAAIRLDENQAKYYCFLLIIYDFFHEVTGNILPGRQIDELQLSCRQYYRDEYEIMRLVSLTAGNNKSKISLLLTR